MTAEGAEWIFVDFERDLGSLSRRKISSSAHPELVNREPVS